MRGLPVRQRTRLTPAQDAFQHGVEVLEHVVVNEPDDHIPVLIQVLCPLRVVFMSVRVRVAIQFHDQAASRAIEICDVRPDGYLSSKLESVQPSVTKAVPKSLLGGGWRLPHVPGELQEEGIDSGRSVVHRATRGRPLTLTLSPAYRGEGTQSAHRLIRALPPPAVWSSSSRVIWLLSPRVLMSRAPWATPRLTHSCGDLPVRKP